MAKKSSRSASSSSSKAESNTGLIVALVIFVLLTLTLGVFTYFGYDGQKQYADEAKKEKTNATNAKKALDEERVRRLVLAIATGNEGPTDQRDLAGLKAQTGTTFTTAIAPASLKELKWNAAQDRPDDTYQDLIAKLRKDKDTAVAEKKTAEKNLNEAKAEFDAALKSANDKAADADKSLKAAQAQALADLKKEQDGYLQRIEKLDKELSEGLKNEKQSNADNLAAAEREKKGLLGKIDGLGRQIEELKIKILPPDSIEADSPKGQVLRVDRQAGTVFINLGSADYLKPKVTFSIFSPSGAGKTTEKRQKKGGVEVVSVLEPHLAVARITETVDENRDPILAGDLLFNPSWSSAGRQHVALAGIFDLDGDGTDDTAELVRNLERQGVIVDAWLDLRERAVKGPGITEGTSFLVLGERPQMSEAMGRSAATNPDHPIALGVSQINSKISDLEKTARDKGVQNVAYLRYLTLIGYKLPKSRPIDPTSSSYIRGAAAAPAAPPEGNDKPK